MLRVYNENEKECWNKIIKSFKNWDVYYLYEYAYSFMIHGDGDIFLVYFENGDDRLCYVVMQSDIAYCDRFHGKLEKGTYFDWETPYGYGGPLTDDVISVDSKKLLLEELTNYCMQNHIVSQFVRFHPLLKNFDVLPEIIETRYLRDTIFMDTTVDADRIMTEMDSKNRNMVRKAIKSGVTIVQKDITKLDDFIPMYNETMEKNGAEDYYTFKKNYFDSLADMKDNACIFYAMYDGMPISGSIIYYNDRLAHYHLSGSHTDYRKYSPSNLLLYEIACWAHERGIQRFHLGGGMAPDDSLFGFKKQFNKEGRAPFIVGRTIFDRNAYNRLLDIRKEGDPEFEKDNGFMIQYRR